MINIAILGCGVVGGGCANLVCENKNIIISDVGEEINVKYILDLRDLSSGPFADKMTADFDVILNDDSITTVIETMGGSRPAYDYTLALLEKGKNVVTSNKEVVSKFGDVLLEAARVHNVSYLFEASVGGGIPLIRTISSSIAPVNSIREISGILNGTTNYILTRMFGCGIDFASALEEAKNKGYAEKNPSADIDGIDAARKTNILAAIATGKLAGEELIHTEGISSITREDGDNAKYARYEIKLLGRVINTEEGTYAYVAPHLIPSSDMLANVSGVYNAVCIFGNFVGDVMLYGQGAGANATASAVVSDVVNIAAHRVGNMPSWKRDNAFPLDFSGYKCKRYVRFAGNVSLEKVISVFGESKILAKNAVIIPEISEKDFASLAKSFEIANMIRLA